MNPLLQRLSELDRKVAFGIIGAICFIIAFQCWVVLRAPWAELQALAATRSQVQSGVARNAGHAAEIAQLEREIEETKQLMSGRDLRSDDEWVPFLITTLDAIAVRHGVSLGGVKPPLRRPVPPFEEVAFAVETRGSYRAVFDWLRDVLKEVDPLIAVDFAIKSIDDGQRVAMTVRLAGYRLPAAGAAAPGAAGAAAR